MATLGIDFGTSNTAAAVMRDGRPHLIEVEPGRATLPTSIFFDPHSRETLYGSAADAALIEGREGRFMRALKSVLGTSLMREKRGIAHERLTLIDVVARFLSMVKARAEAETGETYTHALSGRPVHFKTNDPARDAQAEVDLRDAYLAAGFASVDFLPEPEAAARAAPKEATEGLGLVVDIGGGTSDFSIFRQEGTTVEILASHGVKIGGTDFDRAISLARIMPLLGRGHEVRAVFGKSTHIAPNAIYNDLATWEKIPFTYTPENRRMAADFARLGVDPEPFERLETVLEMELGHDLAFAAEAGKIALNAPAAEEVKLDMSVVEPGLAPLLTRMHLHMVLDELIDGIDAAAAQTLEEAGIAGEEIARVVFVGGTSLMLGVEAAMKARFPAARLERAEAFTAVAEGLARAAADRA